MDPSELLQIWDRIDLHNRQLGWARFDHRDFLCHPAFMSLSGHRAQKLVRYVLGVLDWGVPFQLRKVMRIPKQVVPTAFYHVGTAYLHRERLGDWASDWESKKADMVCESALERRLEAEYVCWGHPYPMHGSRWRTALVQEMPPSCAHHVARLGTLLLQIGKAHSNPEFVKMGISAARAVLAYHNWHEYSDGSCTVSYYPDTEDETINTCADVAALFACIPPEMCPQECQTRLEGIVRMVLREQRKDGSWYYCTAKHYEKFQDTRRIDNHHSAMVLQALAKIICLGNLPHSLKGKTQLAIEKGLAFYLEHFYLDDGTGSSFPEGRHRTGIVGYTEGIAAIFWVMQSKAVRQPDLKTRAIAMVPKMLHKALNFLDRKTGDVAIERFWGYNHHIRSLRWGSGPLMESMMYSLAPDEQFIA